MLGSTLLREIRYLLVIIEDAEGLSEIQINTSIHGNAECFGYARKDIVTEILTGGKLSPGES